ncbi:L-malyl-CoA/beta-methylmalyl-CoA lyase [Vibrio astriarenae]|nr:L-malyl-CoA/beta-methylmalyl-CoA lyase [Vibrio sp. C7]
MKERLYRSLLYVPGHRGDLLAKSLKGEADIIVLDLEDSVPAEHKDEARRNIGLIQGEVKAAGKVLAVRINSLPEMIVTDIESIVSCGVDTIVVPKVDEEGQIHQLVGHLATSLGDSSKSMAIVAMIESPKGLHNAKTIAASHPWVKALNLGTEDFALEMGMEPSWDSLLYPSQQVLLAAKAAGKLALGYSGSIAEFRNIDLFTSIVERSAKLGFDGGFAIHPKQIGPLNSAFSPKKTEIELAHKIVVAFEEALQRGDGAVNVEGKMVDRPVAIRAQVMLDKAQQIAQRNQQHDLVS